MARDLLNILTDFLKERKQRVALNGQHSEWSNRHCTGVSQGSILGSLLFLIYINYLSYNLRLNPKHYADDFSLFLFVHDINQSAVKLYDELGKLSSWAFRWKMSFQLDINKQAQKVVFSRKLQKPNHLSSTFRGSCSTQSEIQKHLGMFLESKLDF